MGLYSDKHLYFSTNCVGHISNINTNTNMIRRKTRQLLFFYSHSKATENINNNNTIITFLLILSIFHFSSECKHIPMKNISRIKNKWQHLKRKSEQYRNRCVLTNDTVDTLIYEWFDERIEQTERKRDSIRKRATKIDTDRNRYIVNDSKIAQERKIALFNLLEIFPRKLL